MKDTRLQQAWDDIEAAIKHRKSADAALDDARTHLANIIEESPADPYVLALINRAARTLNDQRALPHFLPTIQGLIVRAQNASAGRRNA